MKYVIGPWFGTTSYAGMMYTFLMLMAVLSHNICRFTNPGTVPLSLTPPKPLEARVHRDYVCKRSGVIKPPTAHWCGEVQRVVLKMDHYCPWVNNVVGLFTQKYFLLFLFYTFLCCLFSAVTIASRAFVCSRSKPIFKVLFLRHECLTCMHFRDTPPNPIPPGREPQPVQPRSCGCDPQRDEFC